MPSIEDFSIRSDRLDDWLKASRTALYRSAICPISVNGSTGARRVASPDTRWRSITLSKSRVSDVARCSDTLRPTRSCSGVTRNGNTRLIAENKR